jgi:hypothetical protein
VRGREGGRKEGRKERKREKRKKERRKKIKEVSIHLWSFPQLRFFFSFKGEVIS